MFGASRKSFLEKLTGRRVGERLAGAIAVNLIVRPDGMRGYPSWSVDEHLRLLDDNGIEMAVLSMSSPGVHFGDDAAALLLGRADRV